MLFPSKKYQGILRNCVLNLKSCSPEDQVQISEYIEKNLTDLMEGLELDDRVSHDDDAFIKALRRYPEDSIAANYINLWNTLNELGASDFPLSELSTFIDSAVLSFSQHFVQPNSREFATEMADEDIVKCMFKGICATFNKAINKINKILH